MTIIVSKGGIGATRVTESGMPRERYLEDYVAANPDSLPFDDIKEDVKLLMLARQWPTRSGPIDVLAVDGDGELYIIETKLFRNPDKRHVVAQILDYGAALWRSHSEGDTFLSELEDLIADQAGSTLNERLRETFSLDEEGVATIRDAIRSTVKDGRFQFVVLMDSLHERLKDLIVFLNERSRFALYAVEMKFYRHEGYEIVIPRLFGAETKTPVTPAGRRSWDEESFFADARHRLSGEALAAVEKVYNFAKATGADIGWGTGRTKGSFNPRYWHLAGKSLFTVSSDGTLELNFKWLNRSESAIAFRDRYIAAIRASGLAALPPDAEVRFITVENWHGKTDRFLEVLKSVM